MADAEHHALAVEDLSRAARLVEQVGFEMLTRSEWGPLYGFSSVTALTAAILALATYGWTALNPDNLTNLYSIAVIGLITVLALVVFAWPLLLSLIHI